MKTSTLNYMMVILTLIFIFFCSCEKDEQSEPNITPIMVFIDKDGLWGADEKGSRKLITSRIGYSRFINDVEVLNGLIYAHYTHGVSVYDIEGNHIKDIDISNLVSYPYMLCILPDSSFAFLDNKNDMVSFTTASGQFVQDVFMGGNSGDNLQNVHGVVVDSNLVVANIGDSTVIKINLNTYNSSIHSIKAEGDLDYFDGTFYCCQRNTVHKAVPELVEYEMLCNLPAYNAAGIAIDKNGQFAYVTSNFGNKIFKVDLINGSCTVFISGLDYPEDIEWIK